MVMSPGRDDARLDDPEELKVCLSAGNDHRSGPRKQKTVSPAWAYTMASSMAENSPVPSAATCRVAAWAVAMAKVKAMVRDVTERIVDSAGGQRSRGDGMLRIPLHRFQSSGLLMHFSSEATVLALWSL